MKEPLYKLKIELVSDIIRDLGEDEKFISEKPRFMTYEIGVTWVHDSEKFLEVEVMKCITEIFLVFQRACGSAQKIFFSFLEFRKNEMKSRWRSKDSETDDIDRTSLRIMDAKLCANELIRWYAINEITKVFWEQ